MYLLAVQPPTVSRVDGYVFSDRRLEGDGAAHASMRPSQWARTGASARDISSRSVPMYGGILCPVSLKTTRSRRRADAPASRRREALPRSQNEGASMRSPNCRSRPACSSREARAIFGCSTVDRRPSTGGDPGGVAPKLTVGPRSSAGAVPCAPGSAPPRDGGDENGRRMASMRSA